MDSEVTTTTTQAPAASEMSSGMEISTAGESKEVNTASGEVAKETKVSGETLDGSENAAEAKPAYTPNYKLKVYDEEKELDDPFLKALIKDADSEKKVKEIAQKFLGFDTVKKRHELTKTEFQEYKQNSQPIVDYYNVASNYLQKGDLESFFGLLKISDQMIWQYAVKKAEESQLPAEQRQQIEHQKQVQRQKEHLESQNQTLMTQQQQQLSQFRAQELSWVLSRPDVNTVVQAFDAKNGPGAFRQLVVEKGLAHHAKTNGAEDLSAEQATQEVMKMIGAFVTPTNTNVTPAPQQAQLIQQNGQPPIIPNVTGRGASPVRKRVLSIKDLNERREELASRGRSS